MAVKNVQETDSGTKPFPKIMKHEDGTILLAMEKTADNSVLGFVLSTNCLGMEICLPLTDRILDHNEPVTLQNV